MPELSIVLPCFNEAGNLGEILSRYQALVSKIDFELVLVDNGSTDNTGKILEGALQSPANRFARLVKVAANIGYGHGIQEGLKVAQGTILAFSHADLQCNPEDVVTALELYRRGTPIGACLVKGRRRGSRPRADRAVTWCYNHLAAWLLHLGAFSMDSQGQLIQWHSADVNAEPKVFSRALLGDILQGPTDFTFDLYVLATAHRRQIKIVEFLVDYKIRQWGKSKLAANPWVRMKTSIKAMCYLVRLRGLSS